MCAYVQILDGLRGWVGANINISVAQVLLRRRGGSDDGAAAGDAEDSDGDAATAAVHEERNRRLASMDGSDTVRQALARAHPAGELRHHDAEEVGAEPAPALRDSEMHFAGST